MDHSIMKFLEEDEDETMHSGADVEAFTAALNRDIEGNASTSQPSDSDSGHTSSQLFPQWQTSSQNENANDQNQHVLNGSQQQEQHSSEIQLKQHGSGPENQQQRIDTSQELNCIPLQQKQPQDDYHQPHLEENTLRFSQTMRIRNSEKNPVHIREPDRMHNPESESQHPKLLKMNNQQAVATEPAVNPTSHGKQVPFGMLLPVIIPQLDKDRAMQLQTLFLKLRKNEISKDVFVRHMRTIVGDQMLKMAVYKLQAQAARNSQTGPNQFSLQSQASEQPQNSKIPYVGASQGTVPQSFAQFHRQGFMSPADSSNAMMDNNGKKSREMEHHSDSHGMSASHTFSSSLSNINQDRERPTIPIQGLSKQQQQHLHFSQASFPIYESKGSNYHPFAGTNVSTSTSSLKQQPHDSQMRQGPVHQGIGTTQLGTSTQAMNVLSVPKLERQNSFSEPRRMQGGTIPHSTNNSSLPHNSVHWQSSTSKEQKNGALSSMTYVKEEPIDQGTEQQHNSQLSSPQGLSSFPLVEIEHGNAITGTLKDETLKMHSSRMGFSTSTGMMPSNSVSSSMAAHLEPNISLSSRIPSVTSPIGPGNSAKTPLKKPSIGQKKQLESLGSSPPLPSKKQKVSGPLSDQSIEQLNDVTAVSGVNLREEEEQLLSGPKEDSRVSEASRRVVQEEEERLILQKIPLQKKLAEIISKCCVKSISNDVERCLSLCVEERMRGLISNLIRVSKQRVDIEKPRHQTVITSDVRQQMTAMNQKAREEWDKKQAEAEKLQKLNEPEGSDGVDGDKEKDDGRGKSLKGNKDEDDKMRTTAANVAARAAVGGDDMLSKWQLMAEQARQKREGGIDAAYGSQLGKDVSRAPLSTSGKVARDNQETEKKGQPTAAVASGLSRKSIRNEFMAPQPKVAHSVSVKDVIAVLEREPQMSKTTLIYRLYEKTRADEAAAD